ncbi:MAG: hypothetical protein GWN01_13795 [Nitrosopumilaceae archaeon]|nr:hypothetical protein [Nitrosopumilaceae archaeon]NIU88338.1 hypothetical protein [Nitrosopumilaceae archaeon]NIX62538.1 hypothetical protein [Nitrosopumilaceae archaeon]
MKKLLFLLFLSISTFFANTDLAAQDGDNFCGYEDLSFEAQIGGKDLPATDTVWVLMIFIDFPDDTTAPNKPVWPVGQGPGFLNTFVDSMPGQSAAHWNFTNFFVDMSFNQFFMVGKPIYQQARHTLDWYKNTS